MAKQTELEAVTERLIRRTVELGRDNDYCKEDMTQFIADVLGVSYADAEGAIGQLYSRRVRLVLEFDEAGYAEDYQVFHPGRVTSVNGYDLQDTIEQFLYDGNHSPSVTNATVEMTVSEIQK